MRNLINNIISAPKKLFNFFRLTFEELKMVDWLGRAKTLKYTAMVVVILIISAGIILLLDRGFLFVRNLVI